jgi:heat shock protein HspQ
MEQAKFNIGQLVHHRLFDYRGVIADVDASFQGTDDWYEKVAKTQPPRDRPWYHVLVHGQPKETYVAERNLEADDTLEPVAHPLVEALFSNFQDGAYQRRGGAN